LKYEVPKSKNKSQAQKKESEAHLCRNIFIKSLKPKMTELHILYTYDDAK